MGRSRGLTVGGGRVEIGTVGQGCDGLAAETRRRDRRSADSGLEGAPGVVGGGREPDREPTEREAVGLRRSQTDGGGGVCGRSSGGRWSGRRAESARGWSGHSASSAEGGGRHFRGRTTRRWSGSARSRAWGVVAESGARRAAGGGSTAGSTRWVGVSTAAVPRCSGSSSAAGRDRGSGLVGEGPTRVARRSGERRATVGRRPVDGGGTVGPRDGG